MKQPMMLSKKACHLSGPARERASRDQTKCSTRDLPFKGAHLANHRDLAVGTAVMHEFGASCLLVSVSTTASAISMLIENLSRLL